MPPHAQAPSGSKTPSPGASPGASADDSTVRTDETETTAVADNTTAAAAASKGGNVPPPPGASPGSPSERRDDLSASGHSRARSRWGFVRGLARTAVETSRGQPAMFKTGDRVSLTTAEATFLSMVARKRIDEVRRGDDEDCGDAGEGATSPLAAAVAARVASDPSSPTASRVASSRKSGFAHLVQAAVARERLRDAVRERLATLTGAESRFLERLVEDPDVALESLENAVHVLDHDPMYNPSLRMKSEFISEFDAGGGALGEDDEDEEEGDDEGGEGGEAGEMMAAGAIRGRRASVIAAQRAARKKSSGVEAGVWDMAMAAAAVAEQEEGGDEPALQHAKSGEATDPLLAAVPVEVPPNNSIRKTMRHTDEDEEDAAVLDRIEEAASPSGGATTASPGGAALDMDENSFQASEGEGGKKVEGGSEGTADADAIDSTHPLMVCCGSLSLMDAVRKEEDLVKEADPEEGVNMEDRALESKKRYLHLEDHGAGERAAAEEGRRRAHLSTWMGSPEDYPILGLGRKRKTKEEVAETKKSIVSNGSDGDKENEDPDNDDPGVDPLEPHVLSPLLMKCLRDHLPYALREENFWLRYSLVRDGASLEVIFSAMRHSPHTVLAIETVDGEVLGSFTSSPWRSNGNEYYGSCEAFVWMLRKRRPCEDDGAEGKDEEGRAAASRSLDEYILRESSLECFPWTHKGNRNVQLSNQKKLFVGGGAPEDPGDDAEKEWGMSLALDKDLMRGTSSLCATFGSGPLIDRSRNEGSGVFEIMNMEIWALTPCMNEEMAEELELGRTFILGHHTKQ
ncbi:hypothetical protein ACHAWF_009356 [Thalassiosira exigua]